jgi:hypothetical protein
LMTPSIRPNKSSIKQKYEVIELRWKQKWLIKQEKKKR